MEELFFHREDLASSFEKDRFLLLYLEMQGAEGLFFLLGPFELLRLQQRSCPNLNLNLNPRFDSAYDFWSWTIFELYKVGGPSVLPVLFELL